MKGKAYKAALKKVGLSINAAGPFLGITSRQSFRIAAGEADLHEAGRKLLLLMIRLETGAAMVSAILANDQDVKKP